MPQTTSAVPPSASAGTEIWAVEEIAHSILFYLDVQSVDVIVNFIQATNELRGYLQDPGLWTELLKVHFGGPRDAALRVESRSTQSRDWERTSRELACVELEEFLQSLDDRKRFDDAVTIVEGDIGRVDNIHDKPLDGIAFPTSSYLMNPHIGAAGVVFRRAGRDLDQFVSEQSFRNGLANGAGWLPAGSVVATPGFDAGVEKLIHCVGPSVGMVDCYELLAQTYENALNSATTPTSTTPVSQNFHFHKNKMVSIRSSILLTATSALALQGHANATNCDADNYSKVAAAVQTLHSNCASWATYLSSGGVWTCDSTCHDAVSNLVDTLPDCTFGGPYGQNYKEVVEGIVKTCGGQVATTSPSSTTAAPSTTTTTPIATTLAPTTSNNKSNGTEAASVTDAPTAAPASPTTTTKGDKNDTVEAGTSASASADAGDTPASGVSTTSGASTQTASSIAALVVIAAGTLLH
ncbi:hypothetical protein JG688_00012802 [Phytophthora aleatoria]|uniref:Macro domain-containing protein n=1 Tax=Phytophthora aleatoria TaxID=2496075 RepID=A0A8J5J2A7_9STRA|nr:hypothetical protein JG688_00012802 [Phytophthora aleatoria]